MVAIGYGTTVKLCRKATIRRHMFVSRALKAYIRGCDDHENRLVSYRLDAWLMRW